MDSYTLNTVNYNYKTLSHEGFGGVCKYIATPKRIGYSRLLVKHENIQSACNTFMCSRLAELCDVYTPKAYLMSTSDETRRLFPMHPFIVGTEWIEDFSAVDYGSIEESPALRQQYWGSMALYAMFCRIADTPQFAYSPAKGFAYDWDEAFDVTDFVIKLCLYNTDAGTEQLRRMLRHFSQHPFESDAELCLQSAASHLNMDADELRSSYIQVMNRFCKVTKAQVAELTGVLSDIYPIPLIVYYEEYIKILQSTVYKGLHRVTVWREGFRPSDFPCDIQTIACGGYGGNHQIHHTPLVIKGYILPSVEVAGNLTDLFRADGFHR